jgi:dTDP-glucose 4,6-dehydratase
MQLDESAHVLLTGGTGFFGKALLRHWLAEHQAGRPVPRVTLLSRAPEKFRMQHPALAALPGLHCMAGDITAPGSFPARLQLSHVLHAAADSTLGPQLTPRQRLAQIIDGTRHVLDYARACGAERFLLTSSGAVYGTQPPDMAHLPEDWNGAPDSMTPALAYGIAKRAAENLCAAYHEEFGLQTVVARCFAFVGPDLPLNVHFAVGNFIRDALHAEAITVNGDGSPVRSYLDQTDLAQWLLALLERGRAGHAYNVGSDEAITIADLAHLVRDLLAPGKPVQVQKRDVGGPRNRYVPSVAKATGELGLRVSVPLGDAIRATAAAHQHKATA